MSVRVSFGHAVAVASASRASHTGDSTLKPWSSCLALIVLAALPSAGYAHVITGCGTVMPAGAVTACIFVTPVEHDDPVAPPATSINMGFIAKTFLDEDTPIDIEFFPIDPTPPPDTESTEYVVSEEITNSTGVTWIDYHLQLGTGIGDAFSLSTPFADFDDPDGPFPLASTELPVAEVLSAFELKFSGGSVPPGGVLTLTYAWDVLGGFTLRQFPTFERAAVPAPGTLALLGLGVAGVALARARLARSVARARR